MQPSVLIVEDDQALSELLHWHFNSEGYEVRTTPDGEESLLLVREHLPDLIVLDWMIESLSGMEVCRQLRRSKETARVPILMLTARDTIPDRLAGFERGVDDYLGKPFDTNELAARLRAIIRRAEGRNRHVLRCGDLELDLVTRKAQRPGLAAVLSDREAELLAFLMRHPDQVQSREVLLDERWLARRGFE